MSTVRIKEGLKLSVKEGLELSKKTDDDNLELFNLFIKEVNRVPAQNIEIERSDAERNRIQNTEEKYSIEHLLTKDTLPDATPDQPTATDADIPLEVQQEIRSNISNMLSTRFAQLGTDEYSKVKDLKDKMKEQITNTYKQIVNPNKQIIDSSKQVLKSFFQMYPAQLVEKYALEAASSYEPAKELSGVPKEYKRNKREAQTNTKVLTLEMFQTDIIKSLSLTVGRKREKGGCTQSELNVFRQDLQTQLSDVTKLPLKSKFRKYYESTSFTHEKLKDTAKKVIDDYTPRDLNALPQKRPLSTAGSQQTNLKQKKAFILFSSDKNGNSDIAQDKDVNQLSKTFSPRD